MEFGRTGEEEGGGGEGKRSINKGEVMQFPKWCVAAQGCGKESEWGVVQKG